MSDEEFLALKNQIKEVGLMCSEINCTFLDLKSDMSELNKSLMDLVTDMRKLKSDVNSLEVF